MSRSTQIGLIIVILLAVFVSITGGALIGGATAYYMTQRSIAEMPTPEVIMQPLDAPVSEQPDSGPVTIPTQDPLSAGTAPDGLTTSDAMIAAARRVSPAVVTVLNITDEVDGSGSGVIISEDGYIITNNHVVEGASKLAVAFSDSTRHDAELIGTDPLSDIAVIRVNAQVPSVAVIGDSTALQPGETVLAIGSPLGNFRNTVTGGLVSALNRSVGMLEGLIQTDASINRGNSGGPLINLHGEVVGINTLVVRGGGGILGTDQAEGLGFAVPSDIFSVVSNQLIASGEMKYPYIGIRYRVIDGDLAVEEDLPVSNGALVSDIQVGTPAENAGLQPDDIITAVDDVSLAQDKSLRYMLIQYQPGDTVRLTVLRDGNEIELELTFATRPDDLEP